MLGGSSHAKSSMAKEPQRSWDSSIPGLTNQAFDSGKMAVILGNLSGCAGKPQKSCTYAKYLLVYQFIMNKSISQLLTNVQLY